MSYVIINSFKYGWFHGEYRNILTSEIIKVLEFLNTFLENDEIKIHQISDPEEIKKMIKIFGDNVSIPYLDTEPYHTLTKFFYKDIIPYLKEYFSTHSNLFVRYKIDRITNVSFYKDVIHQYIPIFNETLELLGICDILDTQLSDFPECLQEIIGEYLIYF